MKRRIVQLAAAALLLASAGPLAAEPADAVGVICNSNRLDYNTVYIPIGFTNPKVTSPATITAVSVSHVFVGSTGGNYWNDGYNPRWNYSGPNIEWWWQYNKLSAPASANFMVHSCG